MKLSKNRQSTFRNSGDVTIEVRIDQETFLVPPTGHLQTTGRGEVYLAFPGDAPMLAFPTETASGSSARLRC